MRALVTAAVFLVSVQSSFAQVQPLVEHSEVASAIRVLEAWIEAQMAYEEWPGLSVGIVHDQDLIWARSFGYANVEKQIPTSEDPLYAIASNTKMFTAIAILKLRDEGKLGLDDPVEKYLPWFADIKGAQRDGMPITIRQVLTHTSGLPREAPGTDWGDGSFPTVEEVISKIPDQTTIYPPETRWKYSNLAVSLAGAIVSAVTSEPYEEYVKKNILDPLGMASTGFVVPEGEKSQVTTGYGRRLPNMKRPVRSVPDVGAVAPAAGLWSSVTDLARFASWQFRLRKYNKFEVLRASTLKEMQRVHWLDDSWEFGFGLGFIIYHKEPHDLVGHGGSHIGFETDFTVSPVDEIGVVALANGDGIRVWPDQPGSVSNRVFTWVVPAIRNALKGAPESAVADLSFSRNIGKYRSRDDDRQVLIVNGSLVMIDPRDPPPFEEMSKLVHIEGNVFQLETRDGYDCPGEQFVFEENEQGEIIRLRTPATSYEKIATW